MSSMKEPLRSVVKDHVQPEDADPSPMPAAVGPAETDVAAQPVHLNWVQGETHAATEDPAADIHVRTVDGLPVA